MSTLLGPWVDDGPFWALLDGEERVVFILPIVGGFRWGLEAGQGYAGSCNTLEEAKRQAEEAATKLGYLIIPDRNFRKKPDGTYEVIHFKSRFEREPPI